MHNRGFAHNAFCTHMCTILPRPLVSFLYGVVQRKTTKTLEPSIYFMERIKIFSKCVLIFLSLSCNLDLWYEGNKFLRHFVAFSNTAPYKEETNMAVASTMTCKIGLLWRHMKPSIGNRVEVPIYWPSITMHYGICIKDLLSFMTVIDSCISLYAARSTAKSKIM